MATTMHPLWRMLVHAAGGTFPAIDGGVELLNADADGTAAIVEFSGHAVVLSDHHTLDELTALGADGYGGASHPDVQRAVAGPTGHIGCFDVVLVHHGRGVGPRDGFRRRSDLADHPRVARAHEHRRDCEVFADERGVVILGRGLVNRREVSVELFDRNTAGRGAGRDLADAALDLVPDGELLFAQVSAGNVTSLRTFLSRGFTPICAEILIHRDGARGR